MPEINTIGNNLSFICPEMYFTMQDQALSYVYCSFSPQEAMGLGVIEITEV